MWLRRVIFIRLDLEEESIMYFWCEKILEDFDELDLRLFSLNEGLLTEQFENVQ